MQIDGFLETIGGGIAKGWAAGLVGDAHVQVEVEILVDGAPAASAMADILREDLRDAGIGEGFHAFEADIGTHLDALVAEADITVREKSTGTLLSTLGDKPLRFVPRAQRRSYSLEDVLVRMPPAATGLAIGQGDKLAIYATFTRSGSLHADHLSQIAALKAAGYKVILSHVPDGDGEISAAADAILVRKNIGYDFGSWWAGLVYALRQDPDLTQRLSSLLLLNDSYFGTLSGEVLAAMETMPVDVSGLCDSYQVSHHLQSFCLLCHQDYLRSGGFTDLLLGYSFPESKADVIQDGEIALSKAIARQGRIIAALHPYDALTQRWRQGLGTRIAAIRDYYAGFGLAATAAEEVDACYHILRRMDAGFAFNPSHLFWQEIVEAGTRIVKRELLLKNPGAIPAPGLRLANLESRGIIDVRALNGFLQSEGMALRFPHAALLQP